MNNLLQQISKPVKNSSSNSIIKYIKNIDTMSKSTAYEYYARLTIFEIFVLAEYKAIVDDKQNSYLKHHKCHRPFFNLHYYIVHNGFIFC